MVTLMALKVLTLTTVITTNLMLVVLYVSQSLNGQFQSVVYTNLHGEHNAELTVMLLGLLLLPYMLWTVVKSWFTRPVKGRQP